MIEYDEEVTIIPKHLTKEFYEQILKNVYGIEQLEIQKIFCTMGSKVGENYCSFIYRVKIDFKNKQTSCTDSIFTIIKSMPNSDSADFLESLETFSKERGIFVEVLPQLEKLLDKKERFSARFYHSLASPIQTIAFEDLGASGYKMASREEGLDEMHARLVLKRLARLHATSMVWEKNHPKTSVNLTVGMLAPAGLANENGMLMHFFSSCFQAMMARVSKWPDYAWIMPKLKKFFENLRENLILCQTPTSADEIRVLNHGDLWVNNMLFKYDASEKTPVDVLFIDFQMTIFGSPGIDLNHFFYSSLQLHLLKYKLMELLTYYHQELCIALDNMKHAGMKPKLQQVINEFQRRASHGFFSTVCILPTICMDSSHTEDSSLENFMDEDFARKKMELMYGAKRVEETFKFTFKEFDKLNIWK